jgi:flagellar assembly factor FliW
MKWTSRQFGELEFSNDNVVDFSDGLFGFEHFHRYVIVHDEDSEPFRWLVSVENTELSFPMLDPALILPGYNPLSVVGPGKEVWVLAALNRNVEHSTVNLRSPVVIDRQTRSAQQVILDDDTLPFKFPLGPARQAAGGT